MARVDPNYYARVQNPDTTTVHWIRQVHMYPGEVTLCGVPIERNWPFFGGTAPKPCKTCYRIEGNSDGD